MPVPTEVARSWSHLLDLLYADTWNADLRRHRSPYVFHGSHDARFRLVSSLQRLGGDLRANERHLLRNFRKYAQRGASSGDSLWHWLALGQHHGLPTRLLDFTYSPLVALHFATRDLRHFGHDGVIWRVRHGHSNRFLPRPLHDLLNAEGSQVFTVELLQAATEHAAPGPFDASALAALEGLSDQPFLVFLEPPSLDQRIVQQYALFGFLSTPEAALDDWLEAHEGTSTRIVIPSHLKWQIRDHLDQSNLNERTLFPDLSGLARWLGLYYTAPPQGGPGSVPEDQTAPPPDTPAQ